MSKERIATVKGYWAKPGVSLNNRLYTVDHIAHAALEAQAMIESGESPHIFSMMTSHGARSPEANDVTATAGRLTSVGVDERGWGTFEADIADTSAGRDVAALVTPKNPYLSGVSMASVWKGEPITQLFDGNEVETSEEGFSLRGIDFTHNPGIPLAARIVSAEAYESELHKQPISMTDKLIFEAVPEAAELITEAPNKTPYGNVTYADPGYQSDGVKRYPVDTSQHVRAAWSYINKASNAAKYSSAQLARIKGKIKSAAKRFGIKINEDMVVWGREIIGSYEATNSTNGTNFQLYDDPNELDKAAFLVAMNAMQTLADLETENDLPDVTDENDDDYEAMIDCPNCGASVNESDQFCATCGTSLTESRPTDKEGVMPEDKQDAPEELSEREQRLIAEAVAKATEATNTAIEELKKATQPQEESEEVKKAREIVAQADAVKAQTEPQITPPVAEENALPNAETLAKLIEEATQKGAQMATEAIKADMIEEIRKQGPRRRGLVARDVLEQSPDEVYGEDPGYRGKALRQKSTAELEKLADAAFTPVIASQAS